MCGPNEEIHASSIFFVIEFTAKPKCRIKIGIAWWQFSKIGGIIWDSSHFEDILCIRKIKQLIDIQSSLKLMFTIK